MSSDFKSTFDEPIKVAQPVGSSLPFGPVLKAAGAGFGILILAAGTGMAAVPLAAASAIAAGAYGVGAGAQAYQANATGVVQRLSYLNPLKN